VQVPADLLYIIKFPKKLYFAQKWCIMSYVLQPTKGDIKMDDDNFSSEEGQVWECHALWDDCDDIEDNE
jgi:hypothetical protein